ncbi:MAG: putative Multidrug resistance-associated protein, partial [Streblomastix strix]
IQIVIVAVDTPFFLYIGLPTLIIFFIVMKIYSRASRNLQRLEAISRSPVLSHFSETVSGAGLSTIRSYQLEKDWAKKFEQLNDDWSIRFIIFMEGKKWATLYSSMVSCIFMIGVVLIGWWRMQPSKLAVAIQAATQFGFLGIFIVQQFVELEKSYHGKKVQLGEGEWSVQEDVPQSANLKEGESLEIIPDNEWPQTGRVEFDKVSFRYRSKLPYVLKDVSFDLRGGEKIGVC